MENDPYLIAEHFNLTVSAMEGNLSIDGFIVSVDLDVERESFDSLLITEVSAEALNRDANLKISQRFNWYTSHRVNRAVP